jgi:hypothetical protein
MGRVSSFRPRRYLRRVTWRSAFKSGFFWFWSGLIILFTALVNQLIAPAIVDAIKADPITRTETAIFHPWTDRLAVKPSFTVEKRVKGNCFDGSGADFGNANAYRCFSGHLIYDPCFAPDTLWQRARGETLVCIGGPWEPRVTLLTVIRLNKPEAFPGHPLPTREEMIAYRKKANPWALELPGGIGCIFVSGASMELADRRYNYICFDEDDPVYGENHIGWVLGDPNRSEPVWRVQFSRTGETAFEEVLVKKAWL